MAVSREYQQRAQRPTWSSEPTVYGGSSPWGQVARTGAWTAAGGAALWAAGRKTYQGDTGFTWLYRGLAGFEQAIPFFGPTLRLPGIVSPFVEHEKIVGGTVNIATNFLGNNRRNTARYISQVTGMSETQLAARGFHARDAAMQFHRTGEFSGRLTLNGRTLADNIFLLRRGDPLNSSYDRFFAAHLSLVDEDLHQQLTSERSAYSGAPRTQAEVNLSRAEDLAILERQRVRQLPEFVPASSRVSLPHFGELSPRTGFALQYARTVGAFASQRLNQLVSTFIEEVPILGSFLPNFNMVVKEGSFFSMQARYAKLGAKIGIVGLGLSTADWLRRNDELGNFVSAGAYGAMTGIIARGAYSASPRVSALVGAGTALATLAPVFDEGILPGLGTVLTRGNLFRSHMSHAFGGVLPFIGAGHRELADSLHPIASKPETALLAGLVVGVGGRKMLNTFVGESAIRSAGLAVSETRPVHGYFDRWRDWASRMRTRSPTTLTGYLDAAKETWNSVEQDMLHGLSSENPRIALQKSIDERWADYINQGDGFLGKGWRQTKAAFTSGGGKLLEELNRSTIWWKNRHLPLRGGAIRFLAGAGAWALATGQLASKESPEELKALYSGDEQVAVRRGRLWEAGGTPYEGADITHHKPHWYPLMMSRAVEKAAWGVTEDQLSPLQKFFLKNFTYELERRNYESRPYPITATAFNDVPFVGEILASTVGRVLKPPKLMHLGEWVQVSESGELEMLHPPDSLSTPPIPELGGLGAAVPVSPFSPKNRFSDFLYSSSEQAGLVGFLQQTYVGITSGGDPRLFSQDTRLQSAEQISSISKKFWDMELGGLLFASEAIRRYYPAKGSEIKEYNPIPNAMPSWLPKDLRTGDPYNIPYGEGRMPGPGYAALHPELEGLNPEDYPLEHKYKILSDVAYWSSEFRTVETQINRRIEAGIYSEATLAKLNRIDQRLKNRRNKLFGQVTDMNEQTKAKAFFSGAGRGWTVAFKKLVAPVEYLFPFGFRPFSKLLSGVETPVEHYEQYHMHGTQLAFWDKPIRDWVRPAFNSFRGLLGFGAPSYLQDVRDVEEHFDKLEYLKWNLLAKNALNEGDSSKAQDYIRLQSNTVTGVDAFGDQNIIRAALPAVQRKYFDAFSSARSLSEREEILQLIPESYRRIYQAQWARMDAELSGDTATLERLQEAYSAYQPDPAEVIAYFDEKGGIPDRSWLGFHPGVDLEDVKLKYAMSEGMDIHDFGFWDSHVRLLARKPYINEEMVDEMMSPKENSNDVRRIIDQTASDFGIIDYDLEVSDVRSSQSRNDVRLNIEDSRFAMRKKYEDRFK